MGAKSCGPFQQDGVSRKHRKPTIFGLHLIFWPHLHILSLSVFVPPKVQLRKSALEKAETAPKHTFHKNGFLSRSAQAAPAAEAVVKAPLYVSPGSPNSRAL